MSPFTTTSDGAVIHQLRGFRLGDAFDVEELVWAVDPEWEVDTHHECDGNVVFVLTPPGSDTCFSMERAATGISVSMGSRRRLAAPWLGPEQHPRGRDPADVLLPGNSKSRMPPMPCLRPQRLCRASSGRT